MQGEQSEGNEGGKAAAGNMARKADIFEPPAAHLLRHWSVLPLFNANRWGLFSLFFQILSF